uniref:Uncharacterized protein U24 n=1 Tax=Hyposoter didymator TaxID=260305 RepID=D7P5Q6_HYPDD|nr:unknown [Hyposoter didymator]
MESFAKMEVELYHLQVERVFSQLAERTLNWDDNEPGDVDGEPVVFCLFMIENRNQREQPAVESFSDSSINDTNSIRKSPTKDTPMVIPKKEVPSASCKAGGYYEKKTHFVPMEVRENWDDGKADEEMVSNRGIFRSVDQNEIEIIQTMAHCYPWLLGDICSVFATLPDVWQLRVEVLFILGELMFGYLSKVESLLNVNSSRAIMQHDWESCSTANQSVRMYFQLLDAVCARASKGKKCIADLIKQSLTAHGHQPVKLILKSKMMHNYLKNGIDCPGREKKFSDQPFSQLTNMIPSNCDLVTTFGTVHVWKSFVGFLQKMYDLNAESFAGYAMCPDQNDLLIVLFDDINTAQQPTADQLTSTAWNSSYARPDESRPMSDLIDSIAGQSLLQGWRTAKHTLYGNASKNYLLQRALSKAHITQSYMYGFINDITKDVTCTARLLRNLTTINGDMETIAKDLCQSVRATMVQAMPNDLLLGALNISRIAENFGINSNRSFMELLVRNEPVKMSFKGLVDVLLNAMRKNAKHTAIDEYVFLHRMSHVRSALCDFNVIANLASQTLRKE